MNALVFLMQFLRTDGKRFSMKYKLIYNQFARDYEKAFRDGFLEHVSGLDLEKELPRARKVLRYDRNLVNPYWALLILMRSSVSNEDLSLILDQFYLNNINLRSLTTYTFRESIKLLSDITWKDHSDQIKNILNGVSIREYSEFLDILAQQHFPTDYAHAVIDSTSPILHDYLNSYEPKYSGQVLALIKTLSAGQVHNKQQANEWLAAFQQ